MFMRSISSQSVEDVIKTVIQIPTVSLVLCKNYLESANKVIDIDKALRFFLLFFWVEVLQHIEEENADEDGALRS